MHMDELIERLVQENLEPVDFQLINESKKHLGHAGDNGTGQTHYKLMVVSSLFVGRSYVERERLVLNTLEVAFTKGLHAISLRLSVPDKAN